MPEAANSQVDNESDNYVIVSIGTETFEVPADPLNSCNSLDDLIFGSFAIDGAGKVVQAGGPEVAVQINFAVPVTDWEDQGLQPPGIDVDLVDNGIRWWANQDRGLGSVDLWDLTDGIATGTASFVGEDAGSGNELGPESGTFEVVCQ